jgi:hypothetical protein
VTGWEPRSEFLRELNAEAESRVMRSNVEAVLCHRFGVLSPEQAARLQGATLETLSRWFNASLTAPSIDAALAN